MTYTIEITTDGVHYTWDSYDDYDDAMDKLHLLTTTFGKDNSDVKRVIDTKHCIVFQYKNITRRYELIINP